MSIDVEREDGMTWLAIGAAVAFVVAMGSLAAFFATQDARLDRLAEWAFVILAVLAIPTMLAVRDRLAGGGIATDVVTIVGVAGIAAVGLGELAITLRQADFRRISPVLAAGFAGFLAWVGGTGALTVATGGLPAAQGLLGIVSVVAALGIMAALMRIPGALSGSTEPPRPLMAAFMVPLAGIVAWLVWLGMSLG